MEVSKTSTDKKLNEVKKDDTFILSYQGDNDKTLEPEQIAKRRSERRFGRMIDPESYKTGSFLRIMTIIIAILVVPLQLFCEGLVVGWETPLILKLQAHFP